MYRLKNIHYNGISGAQVTSTGSASTEALTSEQIQVIFICKRLSKFFAVGYWVVFQCWHAPRCWNHTSLPVIQINFPFPLRQFSYLPSNNKLLLWVLNLFLTWKLACPMLLLQYILLPWLRNKVVQRKMPGTEASNFFLSHAPSQQRSQFSSQIKIIVMQQWAIRYIRRRAWATIAGEQWNMGKHYILPHKFPDTLEIEMGMNFILQKDKWYLKSL